jgi:hypothetical protein
MLDLDPLFPCTLPCHQLYYKYWHALDKDFRIANDDPAILFLSEFTGIEDYIRKISFNKRYGYKKAVKLGYYCERYNWYSFIGDIVDINRSKPVRCGKPMRGAYNDTLEDRGGYIKQWKEAPVIDCHTHFVADFGVFKDEPGYRQGEVVTNKRLYAYISLIVLGEYAIYSMIIGHGDYLKDDIMSVLHIGTLDYLMKNTKAKYLEYHTYKSGLQGLQDWKRYFLFRPQPCQWKYVLTHRFE